MGSAVDEELASSIAWLLAQGTAHGIPLVDERTLEVFNPEVLEVVDPCRCHLDHTPCRAALARG